MIDFTVAIPTFNGASRLPEVLDRLRSQINVEHLSWEIIVVDNNSTDATAKVVQEYQATWSSACPLKYYLEVNQGAAFARQRAVEEAHGKFIGFLDDDNLPAPNWVAASHHFGQEHPQAGAYGSRIYGDFEVEPPENFNQIACFLALVDRGPKAKLYEPHKRILPPGAGLVVRKQAWCENVPKKLILNHKGREAGLASEDLEVELYIQRAGWEIWYNPEMQVYHRIPHWRLEKDYLLSLIRCIGLSKHHIRMLGVETWQKPLAFLAYIANDLRKLVIHLFKYGNAVKSDLIVACERELLLNSLLSPFHLWRKRYLDTATTRYLFRKFRFFVGAYKVRNVYD